MKLFTLPAAPNPTKVMLYIAERAELGCDLPVEQEVVNVFKGENRKPPYLKINPFGTMPALQLNSGETIFESLPIIEYLEEKFPDGALFGASAEVRAVNRNLERVADARVMMPSASYVHATNSPLGWAPDPAVAENARGAFERGLQYFEELLSDGRPLLAGERVTVADCTLQGALQFLRFRELQDLSAFPNVTRWSQDYRERPAAKEVLVF